MDTQRRTWEQYRSCLMKYKYNTAINIRGLNIVVKYNVRIIEEPL